MKLDLTDSIEKLEKIKIAVKQIEIKFKEIRDARKNKDSMEEQNPDMDGFKESDNQD